MISSNLDTSNVNEQYTGSSVQLNEIISQSYQYGATTSGILRTTLEPISLHERAGIKTSGSPEVNVFDVAAYILNKLGEMSAMKLQKLVYYCQAWSLVWDEAPLFKENIEAWANGPVVRELFDYHRGMFTVDSIETGNPRLLNKTQKETVDAVLEFYGDKSAQWLIDLSHQERPWRETRRGIPDTVPCSRMIPLDLIAEYYSSIIKT